MAQTFLMDRNIEKLVSKDRVEKIHSFAERQYTTTLKHYAGRNQTDPEKIKYDCMVGKIEEWGVYDYLTAQGCVCSELDMNVYSSDKKSWTKDMVCDGVFITVKSQSFEQSSRFGTSWTFQYNRNGMGHRDKIFDNHEKDYIFAASLVRMNADGSAVVSIKAVIWVSDLFKYNLFGEPKSPNLIGIKKVVYYDDIIKKVKNLYVR